MSYLKLSAQEQAADDMIEECLPSNAQDNTTLHPRDGIIVGPFVVSTLRTNAEGRVGAVEMLGQVLRRCRGYA